MFNKTFNVQVRDESGAVKEEERGSYTADFFDLTPEVFDQHFMVNTIGPFSVTKALRSLLTKSEKAPVVAHVSSIMGSIAESRGAYNAGMYRVSKSALNMVNMLMVSALPEAACVVLHPGWVKTDMGGENAAVEPVDSAAGMADILLNLTPEKSGKFYDFQGKELPW